MDNEQFEQNDKRIESVYSSKIRAGKRRTYFFDVRATRGNDYFLTITESRKRFDNNGYDRHKIFLYKEDFNKFLKAVNEAVDFVKTELMPDFDFNAFNHEEAFASDDYGTIPAPTVPNNLEAQGGNVVSIPVSETEPVTEKEQDIELSAITEKKPLEARDSSASKGDNLSNEEVDKW